MRDIFVVGAQKAGSTYLHNLLVRDPRFVESTTKEPHYFSSTLHGDARWDELFSLREDTVARVDSSVSYLHIEGIAERMHAALGSAPLILMAVREPLDRAISSYFHAVKHGRETRRIGVALDVAGENYRDVRATEERAVRRALSRGACLMRPARGEQHADETYADPLFAFRYAANSFYRSQLSAFTGLFDQVRVIDFTTLIRTPDRVLERIYALMGVTPPEPAGNVDRTNPTRVGRRKVLRNYYHNLRPFTGSARASVSTARAAPRILSLEYDSKRARTVLPPLSWAQPASEEYRALLAGPLAL